MRLASAVFPSSSGLTDTHCHLNLSPILESWREQWQKAQERGVVSAWIPGTSVETSRKSWEIAQQDANLWSLVGIHPGEIAEDLHLNVDMVVNALEKIIVADQKLAQPKIIGVGEIGLDYFRLEGVTAKMVREKQKQLCRRLLELANKYQLFVSLHVRDQKNPEQPEQDNAYWDMLALLKEASFAQPFILHCSSGPLSYIARAVELGAYVSFAGNVTYPNAQPLREIWKLVPSDRHLIETDVPFLPPQGFRGKTCEPWMIAETANWIQANLSTKNE